LEIVDERRQVGPVAGVVQVVSEAKIGREGHVHAGLVVPVPAPEYHRPRERRQGHTREHDPAKPALHAAGASALLASTPVRWPWVTSSWCCSLAIARASQSQTSASTALVI